MGAGWADDDATSGVRVGAILAANGMREGRRPPAHCEAAQRPRQSRCKSGALSTVQEDSAPMHRDCFVTRWRSLLAMSGGYSFRRDAPAPRPALPHRLAQQELDLPVEAAQVVLRPALDRVAEVAVDAQQERLPLRHGSASYSVPVLTTGWAALLAAEHHEQVADHRRLALLVELHDARFCDSSSSAFSTMPTAPSTIFVRAATMALACWRCSIAVGDLRRVGQVADARLDAPRRRPWPAGRAARLAGACDTSAVCVLQGDSSSVLVRVVRVAASPARAAPTRSASATYSS